MSSLLLSSFLVFARSGYTSPLTTAPQRFRSQSPRPRPQESPRVRREDPQGPASYRSRHQAQQGHGLHRDRHPREHAHPPHPSPHQPRRSQDQRRAHRGEGWGAGQEEGQDQEGESCAKATLGWRACRSIRAHPVPASQTSLHPLATTLARRSSSLSRTTA